MKCIAPILILLTFLSGQPSEAQLLREVGIKAGLSAANQDWHSSPINFATQTKLGLDFGIFVEWFDLPFFSALTEVHYIQFGSKVTTDISVTTAAFPDGTGQFLAFTSRVDYLSIPIMAKFRLAELPFSPYIILGPSVNLFLGDRSEDLAIHLKDSKHVGLAGVFGAGIEFFDVAPFRIGAEFRYNPSFQNGFSVGPLTVNNRTFEVLVTLGY